MTYRINKIVTTRFVILRIGEDAAEPVTFKDEKGDTIKHFMSESDAKLALESLPDSPSYSPSSTAFRPVSS